MDGGTTKQITRALKKAIRRKICKQTIKGSQNMYEKLDQLTGPSILKSVIEENFREIGRITFISNIQAVERITKANTEDSATLCNRIAKPRQM